MRKIFGIVIAILLSAVCTNLYAQNSWGEYLQQAKEAKEYLKKAPKGTVLSCTADKPMHNGGVLNEMYACERGGSADWYGKMAGISLNDALTSGWEIVSQTKIPVELMNGNIGYQMVFILKKK